MIFEIDDIILFSKRHKDETIRQIIRYDSGYLKDMFLKDDRIIFSDRCFRELCRLTKGHTDNWEQGESKNIFHKLKLYARPYSYDFNNKELEQINKERLNKLNSNNYDSLI